jgi:hypothetical protein
MSETTPNTAPAPGRNEPCTCGSGKKFKKCCGFNAATTGFTPTAAAAGEGAEGGDAASGGLIPGLDPSQIDQQWLMQMSQAMSRLPKGQMQKLQALIQKAMSGKDVSRDAEALEKTLPVELQGLLKAAPTPDEKTSEMSGEEVKDTKLARTWRKLFGKK